MLERVTLDEVPVYRRSDKNKRFAEKTVKEFLQLNCDAVRVSGWPIPRDTKSLRSTMYKAVKENCATAAVHVTADKDHVYLVRAR